MKSVLATLLLIIVILALYEATIGGEDGTQARVEERAGRIHTHIERIDP